MIPAFRSLGAGASAAAADKTRLVCIESVHGAAGSNAWGATKNLWAPAAVGRDFELIPEGALPSLEPWRKYLTIVSNTDVRMAEAFEAPEIGGDHFRSSAVFLTQAHPKQTQGSDLYVGTSFDQIVARRIAEDTAIPSMQLCIENLDQAGGCYYNYACAYTDTISWASPSEPLPDDSQSARRVRAAVRRRQEQRGSHVTAARRTRASSTGSSARRRRLKRELGSTDQQRLDKYLEDIRELERRIQAVEARNSSGEPREIPEAPIGVPDSFAEHMKLMFDFQVLALQSDMTRVISFKTGRDASSRVVSGERHEQGIPPGVAPRRPRGGDPRVQPDQPLSREPCCRTSSRSCTNTIEGDSNLLEKTVIMYGSPMADGEHPQPPAVPAAAAGSWQRHARGQPAPQGARRNADGERDAGPDAQVRPRQREATSVTARASSR